MVSIILAILLVNGVYKLYMKLMGANVMFFDGKKKLAWYIAVSFILFSILRI